MARKKRKSRKKRWIILAVIILLVILGAVGVVRSKKEKPVAVTAEKVELRDITSIVSATGKVYPEMEVKISSEVAGEIIELPVREGQKVKRGDLLCRVKPDTYQAQVKQMEASVAAARASSMQQKAQLLQAELDLRRIEDLFDKAIVSQAELDAARTSVEVARASYQSSEYNIEQREMLLEEAEEALERTTIYAPMDGTISVLASELGERVVGTGQFAGTEIMRVADLENMEVRIEVSENDIVNVKVGDHVIINIDALPDDEFEGNVTEVASSAVTTGARTQEEITTFEVRIRIDNLDRRIRPGMTATADIETKTVLDVVSVPLQSVTVRDAAEVRRQLEGMGNKNGGNDGQKEKKDRDEQSHDKQPESTTLDDDAAGEDDSSENAGASGDDNGESGEASRPDETKDKDKGEAGGKDKGENSSDEDDNLRHIVFVVKDGIARIREVETGIADNKYIEVISGLEPGEQVVSGSYTAITRQLRHEKPVEVKEKPGGERRSPGGRP